MILGFLPLLQDSGIYENGQDAGGQIGREWTTAAMKVDKTPVGLVDAMAAGAEARNPGRSAAQSPSSSSADGLGAAPDRDA